MQRELTILCAMTAAFAALAERQPYDRYQSIVDRQMFGPLPPGFDPTKSPAEVAKSSSTSAAAKELTKEQEKVKSAIRFSVINVTPDGSTAIGFTDNSDPKAPVHYYLKVGEKRNGWEVKEADAQEATMTIVKDGVEVALKLGGDSSSQGGQKGGAAASIANPVTMGGANRRGSLFPGRAGFASSLRERRMLREQQAAAQAEAAEKARKQAAEEREARRAEDEARRAEQAAEREEQRKQLLQIQEELRKAREERQQQNKAQQSPEDADG